MKDYILKRSMELACGASLLLGSGAHAAEVRIPVESVSRLQLLEQKASESDLYRAKYLSLEKILDNMLALLPADEDVDASNRQARFGQLSKLLEKAAQADTLIREIDVIRSDMEGIQQQVDALKSQLEKLEEERDKAMADIQAYKTDNQRLEARTVGLRETIERLLLGEFEYYEVKEGDTLLGIAKNPMVYGDPSRAVWLRQANEGRVKQLNNLRKGEVLVIPRFPPNRSYEF